MLLVPWLSLAYTPALVTRQHVAARQQPAARRCAAPRAQQISLEKLQLGDGEVATATPPLEPSHHRHAHTTTTTATAAADAIRGGALARRRLQPSRVLVQRARLRLQGGRAL